MVYMADVDDDTCARCERSDVELSPHTIRFVDDRDPESGDLCPTCVRRIREADNGVRSIT